MTAPMHIANPLPTALAHYELELCQTGARIGVSVDSLPEVRVEGYPGVNGKLRMLLTALRNARRGKKSAHSTLLLWTSMGLIDTVTWSSRRSRNAVVLHDPIPLRRQVGFDRLSKAAAARLVSSRSPIVISHSDDALREARELLPRHDHIQLPHPILTDQRTSSRAETPTVVVAGQFKPQRDIRLLQELGPMLRSRGIITRIHGRGWPDLPGWDVDSRFLPEDELDRVLATAWAVILPYRFYFQSGVAIRALELGTRAISPRNSFATEVLDAESIVSDEASLADWLGAVDATLARPDASVELFTRYRAHVDRQWAVAYRSGMLTVSGGDQS